MLTVERLHDVLRYDPATGVFTWLISPAQNTRVGSVAGATSGGYRLIRVDGRRYKAHRLAWFYMTGEWPLSRIDHKDTNRGNNIWTNLRLATNSQNKANMGKRADNKSGYKGVRWYEQTKKWNAQIRCQGKNRNLGYFTDPEKAHAAYCEAAVKLFGEFARAG